MRSSRAGGLEQISDEAGCRPSWCGKVLADHPQELAAYLAGKETLANWFFGQVMRAGGGRLDPGLVRAELERQLSGTRRNQVKYFL